MSPIFAAKSNANKLAVAPGSKLKDLVGGVSLEDVGRYNWGTDKTPEINRALVELVGCKTVNEMDPLLSELDPSLGPAGDIHLPVPWKPDETAYEFDKKLTVKLKKRLPMPAVAITELPLWFEPNNPAKKCKITYSLEGRDLRADKTDLEVHVARYLDRQGKSQSSYYEVIERRRDQKSEEEARKAFKVQTEAENPTEKIERPSGTDGDTDTHIWREHDENVAQWSSVTREWDGASQATKGILSGGAYINSTCAPYSVLVRYYKHTDDAKIAIAFRESFYPRWTVERGGRRTLDPASLVVKWAVTHDTNEKLQHGQLLVIDKHKATVVRVALDKRTIAAGTLDLTAQASAFKRADMPYRVQIQVHSGPDEPDGLALAVMPTQVRAYNYAKVQFLAFNVKPPSPYSGDSDHDVDITARCNAMIEAVKVAKTKSDPADDILKVFMAPEFYFRGPEGAYPVEKIETIMPKLLVEADKIGYKDWMFVFGSAIGYQQHENTASHIRLRHAWPDHLFTFSDAKPGEVTVTPRLPATEAIIPLAGWVVFQGTRGTKITTVTEVEKYKKYKLTLPGAAFTNGDVLIRVPALEVLEVQPSGSAVTRIRVKGPICERIPPTSVGGQKWAVYQGTASASINASTRVGTTKDEFWLDLDAPKPFRKSMPMQLDEPITSEITNTALVQKGYPSPYMGDGGLSHAAIYKEYISHIDFARDKSLLWTDATNRKVQVSGTTRTALPTFGSVDLGGANPNVKRDHATSREVGSEINKTGGGGGVYTMYDITFGLEVCLDHARNRLWEFYEGTKKQAKPGDPKVQIHLIPSWGMGIGGGKVVCPTGTGPVFNVDGQRGDSVARLNVVGSRCDKHPAKTGTLGATCDEPVRRYICPTGSCKVVRSAAGKCLTHKGTALVAFVTCAATPRLACNGGCAINKRCVHPKTTPILKCSNCNKQHRQGTLCGCGAPASVAVTAACSNSYEESAGTCPDCSSATISRCPEKFKTLGPPLTFRGEPELVASVIAPYFNLTGNNGIGSVSAYDPVDIPPPDVV